MNFLGNIVASLATVVNYALTFYLYIIFASVVLSFVNPDRYNPIVRFIRDMTEPAFRLVRRYMPFVVVGNFDLSPVVIIFAISFIQQLIGRTFIFGP